MIVLPLLVIVTVFVSTVQGLMCTVGYAFPDAQGRIPNDPNNFLASVTCSTKCIVAFAKTAQQPTGQIVASCASDADSGCDTGFVLDVNTWTEIKCCSTDNCNSQNGNFPWAGYDWATPRNPNMGSVTSPPSTTDTPTNSPTDISPTQPAATIQCTVGTSVPDGQGGVIKQITSQPCSTQCYAIYTHSSFGPSNVGTISGGCASDINRECSFQGTTVNPLTPSQWVQVKCCNTSDNCNALDWNAGQYDWTTPRGNATISGTGTNTQPTPTGTGTGTTTATTTQSPTGTGTGTNTTTSSQPTSSTPTSQPIGGNNNKTLASTGIHANTASSMIMSPVVFVGIMVTSMMM